MLKDKTSKILLAGGMAAAGLVAGIAGIAGAQTSAVKAISSTNTQVTAQTVDTPEPGDVADSAGTKTRQHAPLGGDGVVSSVSGSTIVMGEESDEGAASYTIDVSKATVTVNGTTGSLSDIKVGQKIFVQGTTNGTQVTATSVSVGRPGEHKESANDTDGNSASESTEAPSIGTASSE